MLARRKVVAGVPDGDHRRRGQDPLHLVILPFDRRAIVETKRLVTVASLPADTDIAPEWDAFIGALNRPAAQERIRLLMERGFHKPGDVETRLDHYVGQIGL